MNRENAKRKATDTTDSSQDLSTSTEAARERKTDLLKKARKKVRKNQRAREEQPTSSIKSHFPVVEKESMATTVEELKGEIFELKEDNSALRRKLKSTSYVITEDLTPANFSLLAYCWDHPEVEDSWSKRGNIIARMKGSKSFKRIEKRSDLPDLPLAICWLLAYDTKA
nr:hypothetical protein BaRGS_011820 [Batillaria attramentaria]